MACKYFPLDKKDNFSLNVKNGVDANFEQLIVVTGKLFFRAPTSKTRFYNLPPAKSIYKRNCFLANSEKMNLHRI